MYFGYPRAHEDDAGRAVRAGLAVVEAVTALNEDGGARNEVNLAVRVGVATGPVVVGDIVGEGAFRHFDSSDAPGFIDGPSRSPADLARGDADGRGARAGVRIRDAAGGGRSRRAQAPTGTRAARCGRAAVPARAPAAFEVHIQARPDPGRRLPVTAQAHPPAMSRACRAIS